MRVGIVGAGFAGLAAGIAFRQCGHEVTVFEKAAVASVAGGAISLAPNALTCLSVLGVRNRIDTSPWSQTPATVRSSDGRVLVRSTLAGLTGGGEYATVPRAQLIGWLAAELPTDRIRYGCTVTDVEADGTIHTGATSEHFDLVVGADGARGIVRRKLWPGAPPLRSTGIAGWAWVSDRQLPEGFGTIWGRSTEFGVLPLLDGRTYVYGGTSIPAADLASFRKWPDPLPALIDDARPETTITPEIFEARPSRRLARGRVVLIGDAAHTMRPTFGQGAALAMEDAITLARGSVSALSRRRPRVLALYGASKAGSYFATPRIAALEVVRNAALRLVPDPLFGVMAGSVSRWTPPASASG
ncbi:FAD-dependent monooxygenase [Mycobacterium sp. MYCO198283]|uniref:FAD-dependent monooxygenase n=1 Tax=Mycobacterium sp. MYCO198283 TaxID=2883505 RepID=UPI001E4C0166|nr:FAD-dependent monooxygenase [Mycobacterium sp. MYCO198283]MCG5431061.1 FAD-dependent monooxygenase [Mycobacterium sp. MYCO198283]